MSMQPIIPTLEDHSTPYRAQAVQALAMFRREWEQVADGESLLDITASVGLILADIAHWLELSPQERYVLLGKELTKDIKAFENQLPQSAIEH